CLRPSCTANVCPTNEGNMVERLDQVLTTCFLSLHLEHLLSSVNDHRAKVPFLNYVPLKQASFKAYFFLRSRTIYLLECLLTDLVILPFVGLPQGDTGDGRPIGVRPSPPPCG